jgi:hypothetical protein
MVGEESIDEIVMSDTSVGPKEIIKEQLEEYDDEEVSKLAMDLYDFLSKDKIDESKELTDQFFDEFYKTPVKDIDFKVEEIDDDTPMEKPKEKEKEEPKEKSKEVQVTFKGGQE